MQASKDGGQELKSDVPAGNYSRRARMRLAAKHAGQERLSHSHIKQHGNGDIDEEHFFIHCQPRSGFLTLFSRSPIKLSMRITWRSKDESSRKQTIDVHTELALAIVSAVSAT